MEKGSEEIYSSYMKITDREGLRKLLASLYEQEKKHEKQLLETLKSPDFDRAFSGMRGFDLDVKPFQTSWKYSSGMGYNDFLHLVMDMEEKAEALYLHIASCAEEEDMKNFFALLAEDEKKHHIWAMDRYELEMLASP
jgi:rubrerythrin